LILLPVHRFRRSSLVGATIIVVVIGGVPGAAADDGLVGASADDGLVQFTKRLAAAGKHTKTLQADFVQRKRLRLFRTEVTSRGRLHYRRPDKLRWETYPPDASVLLIIGSKAELRLPGERPRTVDLRRDEAMKAVVEQLMVWLGARSADSRARWHGAVKRKSHGYRLLLRPSVPTLKKHIQSMLVEFDKDLLLNVVEVKHPGGDKSVITLTNMRTNPLLPKGILD